MHKIFIASALALSLVGGASAMAAPKTAAAPKAAPAPATSKQADCAQQWKAQKSHTETKKAFMTACTKA